MGLYKRTKVQLQRWLRKVNLLSHAEKVNFLLKKIRLYRKNKLFVKEFPDFILPPDHLAFDAYSAPDWFYYKTGGEVNAQFIASLIKEYCQNDKPLNSVYEWGCGPGRIIRHLPSVLGENVSVFGSDYNVETVEWCQKNLPGVEFFLNGLNPPIIKPDQSFDFIYVISVFTHLSEENCLRWADELYRLLNPNGLLLVTTKGDPVSADEMINAELEEYQQRGLLVKGQYEEGKKMFLTRHSPRYVRDKLLARYEILDHVPNAFPFVGQDYWIAKRIQDI